MTSTAGRSPRLKSLTGTPDGPRLAEPAPAGPSSGAPSVVAEGVLSAVGPDRQVPAQRLIGWLHIAAPADRNGTARATSHCSCGRHLTAHGRPDVLALIASHHEHRTLCLLHNAPERRRAA
jgi:hypothetical protein